MSIKFSLLLAGAFFRTAGSQRDERRGKKPPTAKKRNMKKRKWSQEVTRHSNALDLDAGVFTWKDPKKIAQSLQQSALKSTRRKGTPYQSAMSMLNFYINRAGKNLDPKQKEILEQAKQELRQLFQKEK
jgi:putative cell wall-binding protein